MIRKIRLADNRGPRVSSRPGRRIRTNCHVNATLLYPPVVPHRSPAPTPSTKGPTPSLLSKTENNKMQSTRLHALLRTRAPRRFASSSSSSSSSASSAAENAQKKAQDAFSAASATAVRIGEYASSALGPFGARLSGLLGCPSPSHFPLPPNANFFLPFATRLYVYKQRISNR
jgi:hypothetical protein